jgi:transitional endoplasmic reticulum ATPase
MKMVIRDKPIDGDFLVEIYSKTEMPSTGKYVKLKYGERSCGAVATYFQSDKEMMLVDRYLRLFLQAKNDDWAEVEEFQPIPASSITLVPMDNVLMDENDVDFTHSLLEGKPICQDYIFPRFYRIFGKKEILVTDVKPDGIVIVDSSTRVSVDTAEAREIKPEERITGPTWDDIGGLDREITDIRRRIEYPLRNPKAFGHFGADVPRGILLSGPPGTGKTLIARALANEAGAYIEIIQGPQIIAPYMGQSEQTLFETFEKARKNSPAIILIDEIDSLAPRRESQRGGAETRLVTTLLVLMDGLKPLDGVIVIGTTNRPEELDEALRRPGRFDRELVIGPPDKIGRQKIMEIHTIRKHMPLAEDVKLDQLAEVTQGFTGADLASLCHEAGYSALFRYFTDEDLRNGKINPDPNMVVTHWDFLQALRSVQPTAMRSGMVEDIRDVSLRDIGGMSELKDLLKENMNAIQSQSQVYEKIGFRPAKGILLYGPSGTGKTMIARATAQDCGVHLITLRGPEIHRKWFGESEELVRKVFAKARQVSPCIILLDEVDALVPVRGRDVTDVREGITNQVITEIERIGPTDQIFVIATTNQPESIDPALRRPGRLDIEVPVNKPDEAERLEIFTIQLNKIRTSPDVDLVKLAAETDQFSGADIAECCRRASLQALKAAKLDASKLDVTMDYLREAIAKVRLTDRFKRLGKIGFPTSN